MTQWLNGILWNKVKTTSSACCCNWERTRSVRSRRSRFWTPPPPGLEKNAKVMSEHTAEVLKTTKAQQDAVAVFSRMHTQSQMAVVPLRQMHEAFRRARA